MGNSSSSDEGDSKPSQNSKQPTAAPGQQKSQITFGAPSKATSQKFYAQPPTFSQPPKKAETPKFFPQPVTYEEPQKKPNKLNLQQIVNTAHKSEKATAKVLSSASAGLEPKANWVKCQRNSIPPNAFEAGHDTDGTRLFICRASHADDIMPGKIVPTHGVAYISYDGKEYAKKAFDVLVGDKYCWAHSGHGKIPKNAVEGGQCGGTGEKLYIGRAKHKNSLTPGKVHPSHNCLFIAYGGQEKNFVNYEILVYK